MNYIVRIYFNDMIFSADLSMQTKVTIGSDRTDTVCLDAAELRRCHVTFTQKGNGVVIKGKNLYDYDGSRISSEYIEAGNRYQIDTVPKIYLAIHPRQDNSSQVITLDSVSEIRIGRDEKNDIVLRNTRTSSFHCKIFKAEEGFRICDTGSRNGTFVNGKQIYEAVLRNRDIINISIYQMEYCDGRIVFHNVGNDMQIHNTDIIYAPESEPGYLSGENSDVTANLYETIPPASTGSYDNPANAWNGHDNDEKVFFNDFYKSRTDETKGFF